MLLTHVSATRRTEPNSPPECSPSAIRLPSRHEQANEQTHAKRDAERLIGMRADHLVRRARAFSGTLLDLAQIDLGRFQTRREPRPRFARFITEVARGGFGQAFRVLHDNLEVL